MRVTTIRLLANPSRAYRIGKGWTGHDIGHPLGNEAGRRPDRLTLPARRRVRPHATATDVPDSRPANSLPSGAADGVAGPVLPACLEVHVFPLEPMETFRATQHRCLT